MLSNSTIAIGMVITVWYVLYSARCRKNFPPGAPAFHPNLRSALETLLAGAAIPGCIFLGYCLFVPDNIAQIVDEKGIALPNKYHLKFDPQIFLLILIGDVVTSWFAVQALLDVEKKVRTNTP